MHDTSETHFLALKRIVRYLQGTLSYDLHIRPFNVDHLVSYNV